VKDGGCRVTIGGSATFPNATDPRHSLISAAYRLICIIAPTSWNGMDGKNLKRECSAEDIVMPMCQSPQIPDALLQASRLPANDNHLSASISISPSLGSKSIVKAGRQAFVVLLLHRAATTLKDWFAFIGVSRT
jgi:hypothetical protein